MELLKHVILAIDDARVKDIKIYETKHITPLFDYAVIATANSSRQLQAAVDHLEEKSIAAGFQIRGVEGVRGGYWALIDLNDVLVNIFTAEERQRYDLDKLWKDLPQLKVEDLLPKNK
ncbi:MAG: ribosome silencing factor [Bacilli bacterium]|jgi:ribosome-associated protein